MARRVASDAIGRLHTVQVELAPSSLADFWRWRVEVRNLIDYRRRDCRWWQSFGSQVWLCNDDRLRGIVSLGSLTEAEVLTAFNRRWVTTLQPIEVSALRREIAAIVHPTMIAPVQVKARYQSISFRISPQFRSRTSPTLSAPTPIIAGVEPMPILI